MNSSITKTVIDNTTKLDREELVVAPISALIFDFDGLIIDSEACMFKAWEALMQPYGVEVSPLQVAGLVGVSTPATALYQQYRQVTKRSLSDEEIRQKVMTVAHQLLDELSERAGVRDYLEYAKQSMLRIALATSSERDHYMPVLTRLKLNHYFDCFIGAEQIEPHLRKPQPDVYLAALKQLGVSAHQAIAFEDSPPGIKAARSAGITTVVVANVLTRHLDLSMANVRLESMEDIALPVLINQLTENK